MAVGVEQQSSTEQDPVVQAFVAAWNTRDEAERDRLLEKSWADDGIFIHTSGQFEGRDVVLKTMARMSGSWPTGSRVSISRVEEHHGWLFYSWEIVRTDRTSHAVGIHVAERAADGRLRKLINFAGPPPVVDG
jgi:hypothetical protein